MSTSRAKFFIQRNVEIIRAFNAKVAKGETVREAIRQISEELEDVSYSLCDAVIFTKGYSFAAEAWEIIHKEEAEKQAKEKQGKKQQPPKAATNVVANA